MSNICPVLCSITTPTCAAGAHPIVEEASVDMDPCNAFTTRPASYVTRRRNLVGLLGLIGMVHTVSSDNAAAGKKKRKRKRKHKKPTTPPPVARADATCIATGGYSNKVRLAQTFRALRSGQLTSATVFLRRNVAGNDFDVEIWSVDQTNAPGDVLAGITIANVPVLALADPPRRLTATFSTPATVTAGLRYALVIAGAEPGTYSLELGPNNPCPDGISFYGDTPNGPLVASITGTDIHFETIVTA